MEPSQGEIWLADLPPPPGHEQSGTRPGLIVLVDIFNHGPAELVVVIPITSKKKNIPFPIETISQESGLLPTSYIKCKDLRSLSKSRLVKMMGG